jgi:hypothetical protein
MVTTKRPSEAPAPITSPLIKERDYKIPTSSLFVLQSAFSLSFVKLLRLRHQRNWPSRSLHRWSAATFLVSHYILVFNAKTSLYLYLLYVDHCLLPLRSNTRQTTIVSLAQIPSSVNKRRCSNTGFSTELGVVRSLSSPVESVHLLSRCHLTLIFPVLLGLGVLLMGADESKPATAVRKCVHPSRSSISRV